MDAENALSSTPPVSKALVEYLRDRFWFDVGHVTTPQEAVTHTLMWKGILLVLEHLEALEAQQREE